MVPALDEAAALRNLRCRSLVSLQGCANKVIFKFPGFEIYCIFPESLPLDFLYERVLHCSIESRDLSPGQ